MDTPGHADFGSEVERILRMVDGVLLLVDAFEGPMPQTKFVLKKSLELHLEPIVVVNKVDRPIAGRTRSLNSLRPVRELNATDEQLDFPIVYASGQEGWIDADPAGTERPSRRPVRARVSHVLPPTAEHNPFRMLATTLEDDPYLGRLLSGRISSGEIRPNPIVKAIRRDGDLIEVVRVTRVLRVQRAQSHGSGCRRSRRHHRDRRTQAGHVAETLCDPQRGDPVP